MWVKQFGSTARRERETARASVLTHVLAAIFPALPQQVLDSKHRPALTERELLNNLQAICKDADKTPVNQVAQGAVGVLSTENRKVWASLRDRLREDPSNRSCRECLAGEHPDDGLDEQDYADRCNSPLC